MDTTEEAVGQDLGDAREMATRKINEALDLVNEARTERKYLAAWKNLRSVLRDNCSVALGNIPSIMLSVETNQGGVGPGERDKKNYVLDGQKESTDILGVRGE